ncbi:ZIP zinc/iron transport family [Calocera viscosa TUFC12733]|uniref:ZIP zinc/iron transport family n=1 Tax=Calocera viscosa (strain TUFC12733) TaxID=1330018 RepID=A0A167FV99_CALVF|nr:ZIP zinc/iron transport family [Calocera viscosa TUFC12733]
MTIVKRDGCGPSDTDNVGLRIGAIFIILVTSLIGTMFPVLTKRVAFMRNIVPNIVFEFAKFFGSGVILATALIHLLEPAADNELGPANQLALGGCISDAWGEYPYAFGICLASLFATFVIELIAFRIGTARLEKLGIADAHAHPGVHHFPQGEEDGMHPPETLENLDATEQGLAAKKMVNEGSASVEEFIDASESNPAIAQILGVAILEFGVIFHSLIIGLTLATSGPDEFTTLFVVIIFHQMFEGLGLGTRLAFLRLPDSWTWVPFFGALLYSIVTPLGMAIGVGVRQSISMGAEGASITSGVLDSISAGILLYTATVELIAHEFIFNEYYHKCSWQKVVFVLVSFALGAGIMALLGKWA